jgi:uncharacterized damage-inducible protein DinB
MKDVFLAFSKYNQKTNLIIYDYIKSLSPNQLLNEVNAYYKTIIDTVFHVMLSDTKWLHRLSNYYVSSIETEQLSSYIIDGKVNKGKWIDNKDEFIELRKKIDIDIIKIIESIPEDDFTKDIEIPWASGTITKQLWKLLFQWFNHHTHHRGQVSIQLDVLGINNDFSLVLDKIE